MGYEGGQLSERNHAAVSQDFLYERFTKEKWPPHSADEA
jgi:hypothetical protein